METFRYICHSVHLISLEYIFKSNFKNKNNALQTPQWLAKGKSGQENLPKI